MFLWLRLEKFSDVSFRMGNNGNNVVHMLIISYDVKALLVQGSAREDVTDQPSCRVTWRPSIAFAARMPFFSKDRGDKAFYQIEMCSIIIFLKFYG